MRRLLIIGLCLMAPPHAHADLPTIDFANLQQNIKTYLQDVKNYLLDAKAYVTQQLQWTEQYRQGLVQAQQYLTETEQLIAFVHNPSLGAVLGLMNQAGLGNDLPVNGYAVLGLINGVRYGGGGLPELQGILSQLGTASSTAYTANHVYSPTDGSLASQRLIANGNSIAGTQGAATTAYDNLTAHEAVLEALRAKLLTASTPKDVSDLQSQINTEQVWVASLHAKLDAIKMAGDAQIASQQQQLAEQTSASLDNQIAQARARGVFQ